MSRFEPIELNLPQSVEWKEGTLYLLDQTRLPQEVVIERHDDLESVFDAIKRLKVRGAPAIGCAGAYGLLVGLGPHLERTQQEFDQKAKEVADRLDSARPTAVNLSWALKRMLGRLEAMNAEGNAPKTNRERFEALLEEAHAIWNEDADCTAAIAAHGSPLIEEGMGILTHCNAGHLAVSRLGTALAPIYAAHAKGMKFKVYADETRPLLQGGRLTAWELQQAGVDVTLICDNMAAHMMSRKKIDMVIVGTDRVAANGDVANKIGTLGVAILAKHFGIPFYVACPYSTIDMQTATGAEIVIEERGAEEVTHFGERRTAPEGIQVANPAFDVTPAELVTAIITERGIFKPPYLESLRRATEPAAEPEEASIRES